MKPNVAHLIALVLYMASQGVQYLQTKPELASELHLGSAALGMLAMVVALASEALFPGKGGGGAQGSGGAAS